MKTTRIALLALALAGAGVFAGAQTRPAAAQISAGIRVGPSGHARVDLGFFHDDLAAYGSWSNHSRYGQVWRPRVDRAGWRPYQYGHWAWTDYGWNWSSDEPFGWATYHYGRWFDDPDYGWEWVPGNEWAPSYVSWQEGDDYIGWAPLPPAVDILAGVVDVLLSPLDYLFVPEGRFLDRRVYDYAVPRRDCERIYRQTRNWTSYRYHGDRLFAAGVPVDRVQRATGHRVPRYEVADLGWNPRHQPRFDGNRGNRQPRQEVVGRQQGRANDGQGRWNRGDRQVDRGEQGRLNRGDRQDRGEQGRWNRGDRQVDRGQDRRQQGRDTWQSRPEARQDRGDRGRQAREQREIPARQDQGRWTRQQPERQDSGRRWQGRQQEPRPDHQQRGNENRGGGGRGNGGGGRPQGNDHNDHNDRGNRHGRHGNG